MCVGQLICVIHCHFARVFALDFVRDFLRDLDLNFDRDLDLAFARALARVFDLPPVGFIAITGSRFFVFKIDSRSCWILLSIVLRHMSYVCCLSVVTLSFWNISSSSFFWLKFNVLNGKLVSARDTKVWSSDYPRPLKTLLTASFNPTVLKINRSVSGLSKLTLYFCILRYNSFKNFQYKFN